MTELIPLIGWFMVASGIALATLAISIIRKERDRG